MSASLPEFRRGAVSPVQCLQEGWGLIKDQYWLFLGITAVGVLIGGAVPFGIILGPMMCGIYLCLLRRRRGGTVAFDMLFKGFDYFAQSLIAMLIQIVPAIIIMIPFYLFFFIGMMSSMGTAGRRGGPPSAPPPMFFISIMGLFVGMVLVLILVGAVFIFTFPLIVDRKLSGLDAVKTSIRAVMGNLSGVVGLLLLNTLLGMVGLLMCYVGAFFFMPVGLAAWAVAYDQVFGIRGDPLV
ncbi:MAG TPA: hypothetical protein VGO91_15670 [Pyrinomonadaceae bacterium]|nr:hypothetical protein [Pyrinomonadaceae bacterium]